MFIFTRNFKVYADFKDGQPALRLPIRSTSFSKVFSEVEVPTKTLHQNLYYSDAKIVQANPANFEFSVEVYSHSLAFNKLFALCLVPNAFDMYIVSGGVYYKLTSAIVSGTTFGIDRNSTLSIDVQGTASNLTNSKTAPSVTLSEADFSTQNSVKVDYLDVTFNSVLLNSSASISLEISNEIKWLDNKTVHNTLTSISTLGPSTAVNTTRRISGNFYTYITGIDTDADNFYDTAYTNVPINIKVKSKGEDVLIFNLPTCVCTSRVSTESSALSRAYDFRLTGTVTSLTSLVTYNY